MPNNLTDDPTQFSSPVQVPAAGDPRTDTSVATPFQQLSNRTANANARLNGIAPSSQVGYSPALPAGVTLGSVSLNATSIAAMQGIPAANRVDGMTVAVKDFGMFQFDIASVQAAVTNAIVQPNDVAGGSPGRWVAQPYGLYGVPNGVAQLDGSSRLLAATVRNGLIYDRASQGSITTSSSVITGTLISLAGLLVGDLIKFQYSVQMTVALGHWAQVQCNTGDPSLGAVAQATNVVTSPASGTPPLNGVLTCGVGSYPVVNAGTHTVSLFGVTDGTVCNYQFASLNVTVSRP